MKGVLKHWLRWASLLRLCLDIPGLAVAATFLSSKTLDRRNAMHCFPMIIAWGIGCINDCFLISYDIRFPTSFFGSLVVQQTILVIVISLGVASLIIGRTALSLQWESNETVLLALIAATTGVSLAIFMGLLYQAVGHSRTSKRSIRSYMLARAGDLSTDNLLRTSDLQWPILQWPILPLLDVEEILDKYPDWAQALLMVPLVIAFIPSLVLSVIWNLPHWIWNILLPWVWNSFFPWVWKFVLRHPVRLLSTVLLRRVRSVESIRFALLQNSFAIGALALISIRVVTLISQFQNEDFLTRAVVRPCDPYESGLSAIISYSEEMYFPRKVPQFLGNRSAFEIRFYPSDYMEVTPQGLKWQATSCTETGDLYNKYPINPHTDDRIWLRRYDCDPISYQNFVYIVVNRQGSHSNKAVRHPNLWFVRRGQDSHVNEADLRFNSVQFLTPPVETFPGMHTDAKLTLKSRRFIVSSGLWDAVTGSQPKYLDVNYYKPTTVLSTINSTSSVPCPARASDGFEIVACGSVDVAYPTGTSAGMTQKQLASDKGPYCDTIEDYRQGSAFDILGSIGGLLALLQGVHIFLFGRPLFWGIFGAKLIAPFGLVGRLATKGFRERLGNYYMTRPREVSDINQPGQDATSLIRMNQFLLDYVLDMGPASISAPGVDTELAGSQLQNPKASNSASELDDFERKEKVASISSNNHEKPTELVDQSRTMGGVHAGV